MDINQVCKKALLMPIVCDKDYDGITLSNGFILSGQKYYSSADEDMSDFSIRFYEIVYRNLLGKLSIKALLSDAGFLCSNELAGDTMNSFNTAANITAGAGKSSRLRTPEDEWPDYLRMYKRNYHCLANFWLLPMEVGRTTRGGMNKAKKPINDYMDNFLEMVRLSVSFDESERLYYRCFEDWDGFVDNHFIRGAYLTSGQIEKYSNSGSEIFIAHALSRIEKRATEIAESKYAVELAELFMTLGIV